MNKCIDTEIQEMLPDLLHGSLDDSARRQVEAHLASCESCREDLDVIRAVKGAAVFAPAIDVDRVVRQIPPYRMIVPGVEQPARTKLVTWLVAAGLILAFVGGGSLVISKQQKTIPAPVASTVLPPAGADVPKAPDASVLPQATTVESTVPAPAHPRVLALASDIDALSDRNLVQLMNDMDQFDALPAAEPEPVLAVDSGDSL
jgi:anti-sigma factor RsiW